MNVDWIIKNLIHDHPNINKANWNNKFYVHLLVSFKLIQKRLNS